MSKINIINNRPGGFGIPGGPVIEGGKSLEVDAKDWAGVEDHPVVTAWVDAGHLTIEGSTAGVRKEKPDSTGAYAVKEKPQGWFVITKDGAEVTKNLRKDDLGDFEASSEEDKAAFVELNKAS